MDFGLAATSRISPALTISTVLGSPGEPRPFLPAPPFDPTHPPASCSCAVLQDPSAPLHLTSAARS